MIASMANVLRTANLILWMGPLPLGLAILSSVHRFRPVLVPNRVGTGSRQGR